MEVVFVGGDLSSGEGVAHMVHAALEGGAVDILVNNAGIQHVSPVEAFPPDRWDAVMAVNLTAPFLATKALLPAMYERGWGRVVHVASAHGIVASPNKAAYVAAKHGLVGFSKVVALEAATRGVTSNCVCPGWVLTPLVQKQIDARAAESGRPVAEEGRLLCGEKHPTQRFTTPEALGDTVCFLCSGAGDNLTGTEMRLDGGWTAQ